MKDLIAIGLLAGLAVSCGANTAAMSPDEIQKKYGVTTAYTDTFPTPEGELKGTVVPVTLSDGRPAQLFLPAKTQGDSQLYVRDEEGLHPATVDKTLRRDDYVRSTQVSTRRAESTTTVAKKKKRSWEKEALIIGGSAAGGAAVGGLAGGKKGAAVGAAAGGIGGLIYDVATRNK